MTVYSFAKGEATLGKACTTEAVKDAYGALKNRIRTKFPKIPISLLEDDPESQSRQKVVAESIVSEGATSDSELLELAKRLIALLEKSPPEPGSTAALKIKNIEAQNLRLSDIIAEGNAVDLRDSKFRGDVLVEGVRSQTQELKKKTLEP
jgi:hypothetical protein